MKKTYDVFSHGKVKPGFSIDQVAKNVAKKTGKDAELIKRRLISGKKAKVKSFDTLEKASRLENILTQAGLEVTLKKQTLKKHASQTLSVSQNKKNNPSQLTFNWPGITTFALLFIISAGIYSTYHWLNNNEPPQNTYLLENTLLLDDRVSMIATFDVKQFRKLLILDSFIQSKQNEFHANNSVLQGLPPYQTLSSEPYFFENTDYLLASLHIEPVQANNTDKSTLPQWFFILSGQYEKGSVLNSLKNNFDIESINNDQYTVTGKTTLPGASAKYVCPEDIKHDPFDGLLHIAIKNDYIVFSESLEVLNDFITRMNNPKKIPQKNQGKIVDWRLFKENRLFTFDLVSQDLLKKDLITQSIYQSIMSDSDSDSEIEIERFRFSIARSIMNPSMNFEIEIDSPDIGAMVKAKKNIDVGLQKIEIKSRDSFPNISKLTQAVSTHYNDILTITARFDQELVHELSSLINEGVAFMFDGLAVALPKKPSAIIQEKLVEFPWDYSLNALLTRDVAYKINEPDQFEPLYQANGFALFLDSAKYESAKKIDLLSKQKTSINTNKKLTDSLLTLGFELKQQLPQKLEKYFSSLNDSGVQRKFQISAITDSNGNSLIRDEHCLKEGIIGAYNHEPLSMFNRFNSVISAKKVIRLTPGTNFFDVHNVKGWYSIKVPTKVSKKKLSLNTERNFSWGGGNSFHLISINGNSLKYTITGKNDDIIAVRSLNKNKQELSPSAFATHSLVSTHYSTTQAYYGEPVYIEVYVAEKWHEQTHEIDFNFSSPERHSINAPAFKADSTAYAYQANRDKPLHKSFEINNLSDDDKHTVNKKLSWQGISLEQIEQYEIGTTATKRAWIGFKHDTSKQWSNRLQSTILLPFEPALIKNRNAISVEIAIDSRASKTANLHFPKITINGVLSPTFQLKHSTGIQMISAQLDLSEEQKNIKKIRGKIHYSLPTEIEVIKIPVRPLGQYSASNDLILSLQALDYGWGKSSHYIITGKIDDLVRAILTDKQGQKFPAEFPTENPDLLVFKTLSEPDYMELHFARNKLTFTENFDLDPFYR